MTLNKTIAHYGTTRLQTAIKDQRWWLTRKKHAELAACFVQQWKVNPRAALRWLHLACSMAGFKSYYDTYLFAAFALGKLPGVK